MREGRLWDREEVILAMALYQKAGRLLGHESAEVQALARLLRRSVGSVATKLANLRSVERKGRGGLRHVSAVDRKVWMEFAGHEKELQEEADRIREARYQKDPRLDEEQIKADEQRILNGVAESTDRLSHTRMRQQTDALRRVVLRNYDGRCSFCGIDIPELLEAAHIIPWSVDVKARLAPTNAICL